MVLQALPTATVSQLTSGQIITSVASAVKELVENSLDAGAKFISVKLDDYGYDCIEVKDDGVGVDIDDIPLMVAPHFTSKLALFEDLSQLDSYGFRGEALSALCATSKLEITSRTKGSNVANTLTFDTKRQVVNRRATAGAVGTTVRASKLFFNLPVRRNYYCKNDNRKKEDFKKVEDLILAFSLVNPEIGFSFVCNKTRIFHKPPCNNFKDCALQVFTHKVFWNLESFSLPIDDHTTVDLLLPKKGSLQGMGRSTNDKVFIFVNRRPVENKIIQGILKKCFSEAAGLDSEKFPISFVSINVLPKDVDVNLDPNKYQVMLEKRDVIGKDLLVALRSYYELDKPAKSEPSDLGNSLNIAETPHQDQALEMKQTRDTRVPEITTDCRQEIPPPADLPGANGDCVSKQYHDVAELETNRTLVPSKDYVVFNDCSKEDVPLQSKNLCVESFTIEQQSALVAEHKEEQQKAAVIEIVNDATAFSKGQCVKDHDGFVAPISLGVGRQNADLANLKVNRVKRVVLPDDDGDDVFLHESKRAKTVHRKPPKVDENYPKITALLDKRKKEVGNTTLETLAAPMGTPVVNEGNVKVFRKAIKVPVSILCVKEASRISPGHTLEKRMTGENREEQLIGKLNNGFWLTGNVSGKISILNHHRLDETIIYRRLLKNYVFPNEDAPNVLDLGKEMARHGALLDSLPRTLPSGEVSDERLTFNGFVVRVKNNSVLLTHICSSPKLTHEALGEILEDIQQNRNIPVEKCRPRRIREFLQKEAVRISRQSPPSMDKSIVEQLFKLWQNDREFDTCFHDKSISNVVHNVSPEQLYQDVTMH